MNRIGMASDASALRAAAWWVVAFVALWPLHGPAEVVLSLGALIALGWLAAQRFRRSEALLSREAWAMTTVLFLSYWLPELFSTFDAIDIRRSLWEVATDLRYLPFLWLVAMAVDRVRNRGLVWTGIAIVIGIWTLDGLLQTWLDFSPVLKLLDTLGFAVNPYMTADRLSGIFGASNLKLGLVLASMSPFALAMARDRWGLLGWIVGALALGTVILLAGARAAWITYALVLLVQGMQLIGARRVLLLVIAGLLGVIVLANFGLYRQAGNDISSWRSDPSAAGASGKLDQRLGRTEAMLSGDSAGMDIALSGRVSIWRTALAMANSHPFNGVGVRDFRKAYSRYAAPDDWWMRGDNHGALHAHQIVLELLSETGVIGLLLWLIGALLAIRAWRYATTSAREKAAAPGLALAVTVFPFNTHLAFYSNFWGGLTLLLAALYAGALFARDGDVTQPAIAADVART
ncbi:MAG: O-antigen ligase family protein [Lysobacteraceae bacterium]